MKIKYIEDYYDQVKEKFPDLETWEIDQILKHGMRSIYQLCSQGADVRLRSRKYRMVMYFGKLFVNPVIRNKYNIIKWRIKLRIKYFFKKPIWDGYYYFGLTEEQYNKYIPKKKGRIKKKIVFDEIYAYKIKEESLLFKQCKYFFKLKMPEEVGLVFYEKNFATRNIEMFAKRDKEGKIQYI